MIARTLVLLACAVSAASAQIFPPAPLADRVNPVGVAWNLDETILDGADISARLATDPRISDFEFRPAFIPIPGSNDSFFSYSTTNYFATEIGNTGPFSASGLKRFGPGPAPTVIAALQAQNYRPVDIEYRRELTYSGGSLPPVLMALAVPNTGANQADWSINIDVGRTTIENLRFTFPTSFRPLDIELSDAFRDSNDDPVFLYAVLAVENSSAAPTGGVNWRVEWDRTASNIAFSQLFNEVGQIGDLEPIDFTQGSDPLYDVIYLDWQGQTRYSQIGIIEPDDLPNQTDYFTGTTSQPRPFQNLPQATAGFRVVDAEYFWVAFDSDAFRRAQAVLLDAPTGLQRRVRDELGAVAVEIPRISNFFSGLDIKPVGEPRIPGIHADKLLKNTGFFAPSGGPSTPLHFLYIAAYAYLNDDPALTEQQLNTCDPSACPPPTTTCNPQLLTVAQIVDRMLSLSDNSAAKTLLDERYTEPALETFIESIVNTGLFNPNLIQDSGCTVDLQLDDATDLIEQIIDGTIISGQPREDLIAALFTPPSSSLQAAFDAVVNDEALQTDLTQQEINDFIANATIRSRVLVSNAIYSVGSTNTPTLRVLHTVWASVPECGSGNLPELNEFVISAYVETDSLDPNSLDAAIAEALRDSIADGLADWQDCADTGCNAADLSSPLSPGVPDGVLTGADFFEFLSRFQAGDLSVDFSSPLNPGTPDGVLTGADFFEFLSLFAAGC